MNDFENIYLQLLNNEKKLRSCILQETLLPLFNADQISLKNRKSDFYYVDKDMKVDYLITQDIYKKSIFQSFISDVKNADDIKQYSFTSMKFHLKNKLKPIKNPLNVLIIKYDFHDYNDFEKKMIKLLGNDIFDKMKDYLIKNVFNPCLSLAGATWNPEFSNSKEYMFMFLNITFSDITLMHQTIHYIQVVTEKDKNIQKTLLELNNNDVMFKTSEIYTYINSFCHLLDGKFSKQEILSGFGSFEKIMQLSVSKNEKISKEQFFKRCLKTKFLKQLLENDPNQQGCIIYILSCIYYNKHISTIKSHLIHYFE